MSLFINHFFYALLLLFFGLLGGFPPFIIIYLQNSQNSSSSSNSSPTLFNLSPLWLKLAIAITGGTLLSGAFLHMLPEAKIYLETMETRFNYPVTNLFCLVSFIGLYTFDILIHMLIKYKNKQYINNQSSFSSDTKYHQFKSFLNENSQVKIPLKDESTTYSDYINKESCKNENIILHSTCEMNQPLKKCLPEQHPEDVPTLDLGTHNSLVRYQSNSNIENKKNPLMSLLLFFALFIHSFVEGMALGATDNLEVLFFPVIVHKTLVAFGLGSSFTDAGYSIKWYCILIFLFSLISPLGFTASYFLKNINSNKTVNTFSGILSALGAGTFLYISLMEMIVPEMLRYRHLSGSIRDGIFVLIMILFGIIIMALI